LSTSSTSWRLSITVSGHPPSLNQRLHWQARRICRPFVDAVGWQAKAFGLPQPLERARVLVTFTHRSRRYLGDVDNLYSRSKCLVDALKGTLIVDDSPAHLRLEVRQQLGKERSVRLEVWPAAHGETA
jgi:hypothetical protein